MWLALIALAAGCVVGLLAGGRLGKLLESRLRWLWLLGAGAVCLSIANRWWPGTGGLWLVVAGYVLMLGFAFRNMNQAGTVLVAAGLLSNLLVIGINGGMPVRGIPAGVQAGGHHHGEQASDRLTGLSDVFYVAPLGETVSAGDILLAGGVGTVAAFAVVRGRRSPGRTAIGAGAGAAS